MKKRIILSLWFIGGVVSGAWAQTSPTVSGAPHAFQGVGKKSNVHDVNVQLRQQMAQLRKDVKSGKISQDQAKVIFGKLKEVRKQELEYFRLNGQKEVTADQKTQLNQLLSQTAALL
jgi:hypothetical protein